MIDQIELAIIDRLKTAVMESGLATKVDSYGGQLDDEMLAAAAQAAPIIWAVFAGMKKKRKVSRTATEFEGTFVIISAAKSLNQVGSRQGGRGGKIVGAYQLIQFAVNTLEGFCPEPLNQALEPDTVSNLFNARVSSEHLAIYSTAFKCRFLWNRSEDSDMHDFETISHSTRPASGTDDTPNMEAEIAQQEPEE